MSVSWQSHMAPGVALGFEVRGVRLLVHFWVKWEAERVQTVALGYKCTITLLPSSISSSWAPSPKDFTALLDNTISWGSNVHMKKPMQDSVHPDHNWCGKEGAGIH